ncbi:lipopolysaccharide biosynthesis protein [Streptomyces sp. NPDC046977]|uniref:lipopolysaccharide biosynthesis protein n=1 Tax=Streptomyces sp. NPDC046977 TaxID=3154703 RepID=UPI0033DAABF7
MSEAQDEPDLLRDQFRQLVRYRALLVTGVLLGLLGGGYLAVTGSDSYVATSEVVLRAATTDPFAAGASSPDKSINIGSERQTAMSNEVAKRAAQQLGLSSRAIPELQSDLQVTNPPNTVVLRFAYTYTDADESARRANALATAFMDARKESTENTIKNTVHGLQKQLDPVVKQRKELDAQIAHLGEGPTLDAATTVQATLVGRISELSSRITELQSLDTTPGSWNRVASPPSAPSGPGLPMMLGLGALVGVAVGLLAAWVRLVFDPTARSEGDVVRALRAPVLGTLPRTRNGPLLAVDHADPRLAEEYRSVAFRLAYDQRFADRRRLLVVAPRGTGETAAAVAVNLAASFAEMGMDVLLVEADLRTPGLSARLRAADGSRPGWARSPQLSEGGWPAGIQVPVDAGESGSFDLVPGRRVRNVARALTSAAAGRLFAEADEPGSAVVVLAPAVLTYADALALADRIDGVLVVADPHAVHRADLDRVRQLISGAGSTVLGSVLHSSPGGGRWAKRRHARRARKAAAARTATAGTGTETPATAATAATTAPTTTGGSTAPALPAEDKTTDTIPLRTVIR